MTHEIMIHGKITSKSGNRFLVEKRIQRTNLWLIENY